MAINGYKSLCRLMNRMRIDHTSIRTTVYYKPPRYRPPYWYVAQDRVMFEDQLTIDNENFIKEVMNDKLKAQKALESPLENGEVENVNVSWTPWTHRVGLIARKIGNYPLWMKDGRKVQTTLVQVCDNHVIKYIPPEEFSPMIPKFKWKPKRPMGCLLVGAETVDPCTVTKNYSGLFDKVGMLPKRTLRRFIVTPNAALPTGTPLLATHFRVGDFLDVRGKTIDRGFQGVMKRWGFKGMPASHGVTKTHRRPGNIGSGGQKARVWPGQKLPGHMGNRWRILRGVEVLRINTHHNVLWLKGVGIPGETGAVITLHDTLLPLRKNKSEPPFPTQPPVDDQPIEFYEESIHVFDAPSITYQDE